MEKWDDRTCSKPPTGDFQLSGKIRIETTNQTNLRTKVSKLGNFMDICLLADINIYSSFLWFPGIWPAGQILWMYLKRLVSGLVWTSKSILELRAMERFLRLNSTIPCRTKPHRPYAAASEQFSMNTRTRLPSLPARQWLCEERATWGFLNGS